MARPHRQSLARRGEKLERGHRSDLVHLVHQLVDDLFDFDERLNEPRLHGIDGLRETLADDRAGAGINEIGSRMHDRVARQELVLRSIFFGGDIKHRVSAEMDWSLFSGAWCIPADTDIPFSLRN